ncbi:MAG: hypothetical protein WC548_02380 [Candidatus Pacearchaeota archaeon]
MMARYNSLGDTIGKWAFLIGVIIAVILGLFGVISSAWVTVLVIIGLIVGLLNIANEEVEPFLLSGIALVIAGALGQAAVSAVPIFARILHSLLLIFVPATIIVALKNVFTLARH